MKREGLTLLDYSLLEPVLEPLKGRRVGFFQQPGNVGDALIRAATCQLFDAAGIDYESWRPGKPCDVIVHGGGGNVGDRYKNCLNNRKEMLKQGVPVVVLPQTLTNTNEDLRCFAIWWRETTSLRMAGCGRLAPDLALYYRADREPPPPTEDVAWAARTDGETYGQWPDRRFDPARLVSGNGAYKEYLDLAAKYRVIVTNRLHFGIAGLLAGRRVILTPNDYFKNIAMYDTWLRDLGCEFAENPGKARI